MRDLTKGSIEGHILTLALPVAVNMATTIAYQLVDLYFLTMIGAEVTAGVNAAANIMLVVGALAQVLAVGAIPLIAQAIGRNDRSCANLIFNQSLVLATVMGAVIVGLVYALTDSYMRVVAADTAAARAGAEFMYWLLPGLGLMLVSTALGSALRSMGAVRAYTVIPAITIALNTLLAPVLIAGWGTGAALGARGAGLATTVATAVGLVLFVMHYRSSVRYLSIDSALLRPRLEQWLRMVRIGLPAGADLVLMFLSTAVVYYVIRDFGPSVQAGFGIASRVLQVILMPGLAIAFAVAPIVGQNFGAGNFDRVRQTFCKSAVMGSGVMLATTIIVYVEAAALVSLFDSDIAAASVASRVLQVLAWTFVAQGLVYVCTFVFQGLGHTLPSLLISALRLVVFCLCMGWLIARANFSPNDVWYVLAACIIVQAALGLWLLRVELRRRMPAAYDHAGARGQHDGRPAQFGPTPRA
jgi:putative MATE family efflux protein